MASKFYNLAKMTVSGTPGTGTITLGSAATVNGVLYLSFAGAGVANGDVVDYAILDTNNSEIGTGTYTSAGTTLTRTVTKSTNANAAISATSAAIVSISPRAETLADASGLTTGTLPVARINGGTANQFVQGDGTFQIQGRKLLNTLTASNSATLSDITSFTVIYNDYEIMFTNIIPATNNTTLEMQFRATAGAFQTTGYLNTTIHFAGGTTVVASLPTTYIGLTGTSAQSNTAPGYTGTFRISNPLTAALKSITGTGIGNSGTTPVNNLVNGYLNNATGIDGFQVLCAAGNITSGTVKIYGIG